MREFRKAIGSTFEKPWALGSKGDGQYVRKAISWALYNAEAHEAIAWAVYDMEARCALAHQSGRTRTSTRKVPGILYWCYFVDEMH